MRKHLAVRWDGKQVVGGAPLWIRTAVSKAPLTPNAIMRLKNTVHVFGPEGKLRTIATPGNWILYDPLSGEISAKSHEVMMTRWEFRDDGFYEREESVTPRAGTEYELALGLRVLAGWTSVTAQSSPRLHRAFEIISHDRGSGAGHATYSVPPKWVSAIPVAEVVLGRLCDEDLETLCIGEVSEQEQIAGLSAAHEMTSRMLEAFFEDWEQGEK